MPVALDLEKQKNPVDVLSRQPTRYIFNPGYQAFITSIMRSFLHVTDFLYTVIGWPDIFLLSFLF